MVKVGLIAQKNLLKVKGDIDNLLKGILITCHTPLLEKALPNDPQAHASCIRAKGGCMIAQQYMCHITWLESCKVYKGP